MRPDESRIDPGERSHCGSARSSGLRRSWNALIIVSMCAGRSLARLSSAVCSALNAAGMLPWDDRAEDEVVSEDFAAYWLAGMLGVSAMAVQNALAQISLEGSPSTAVMTTNVTRLTMDTGGGSDRQMAPVSSMISDY
jgi:uncharacterized membrane protein YoaK (UPF0700 family)